MRDLTSAHDRALSQKKILNSLFFLFVAVLFLLVLNRARYGVDLGDEAFSLAVPYRFSLGDVPFVDEISPQQTSSFLLFPIIKIYTSLFGTEFIVLFMRYIYLLLVGGIIWVIYQTLKQRVDARIALLIPLSLLVFAPFGAILLNYNRLAFLMFSAGCFLGVLKKEKLFWSGLFHGLAMIAYPFFAIPCAAFFVIQIVRYRSFKIVPYIYGALLPLTGLLLVILRIGFNNFLESLWSLRSGIHGGGLEKLNRIILEFWKQIHYKEIIVLYCFGVFILARTYRKAALALIVLILLPFFAFQFPSPAAPSWYFIVYGLFAPYLMLFVKPQDMFLRALFIEIWIPSFIAAMTTAFISANGAVNFGIGVVPGVMVTSILLVSILRTWVTDFRDDLELLIPACILIILLIFQYSFVYSEGSYSKLSEKVEKGPYRGLYTSAAKKLYLTSIFQDFNQFKLETGKVLFFDFFPAGYLFSTMKPASNAVWLLSPQQFNTGRDSTLKYYQDESNLPDVAVKINVIYAYTGTPVKLEYAKDDPLVNFIQGVDRNVYHGKYCDIYYDQR